jgi:hypothetical protein
MSVVRRESLRRWSLVSAGVATLCLLPAAVAAWPAGPAAGLDPAELRERILASADLPYQGYVTTDGRTGLPALPELAEVSGLLGGSARIRAWYAGPASWRVAELTTIGERDTYRAPDGLYQWDFERNLLTLVTGEQLVWLPGASDVVPPALARQLLGFEGRVEPLPARRVAGVDAAGVRLVPEDPDTTVGRVDAWADPSTGLPVHVEVSARGGADPAFTSRFLDLRQDAPDAAVLTPPVNPDGAGFTVTSATKISEALAAALPGQLPDTLAGRARQSPAATAGIGGGAIYGTGFSAMVVLALPGRLGGEMVDTGRNGNGTPVEMAGAEAYELRASLLTALVVHADHANVDRSTVHTWLLAGPVQPELLRRAAAELVDGTAS